jgi:hypothetical protein
MIFFYLFIQPPLFYSTTDKFRILQSTFKIYFVRGQGRVCFDISMMAAIALYQVGVPGFNRLILVCHKYQHIPYIQCLVRKCIVWCHANSIRLVLSNNKYRLEGR